MDELRREEEESPATSRFILLHSLLLRRLLFASAISILPDPSEKKGSCCFPSNVVFPRDRTNRTGPGFSRGQFGSSPFFPCFVSGRGEKENEKRAMYQALSPSHSSFVLS